MSLHHLAPIVLLFNFSWCSSLSKNKELIARCIFSPDSEYDVEFKTAADENAGTDANVYFQMIGEDGESQEIELKNREGGYFNRGQLDRFRIRARNVGRVSYGH